MSPSFYLDKNSGDRIHFLEVAENLAKLGCEVTVFAPSYKKLNKAVPFKIIYVPALKNEKLYNVSFEIMLVFVLFYYSIKERPQVLYFRTHLFNIASFVISWFLKIPLVIEKNGLMVDELELKGVNPFLIKFINFIDKLNLKSAKKVICVTEGIKKLYSQEFKINEDKFVVIGNGVNIDIFKPMDLSVSRRMMKLPLDKKIVCFVGSLAPWQGVKKLIDAAEKIEDRVLFLIVGDGIERKVLQEEINNKGLMERFIFTGFVHYTDVPLYINASDICAAPFIMERNQKIGLSPLKIFSYLACGKAVIASDIKGITEIIEGEGCGRVFDISNIDDFCAKLMALLNNDNTRGKMEANAVRLAKEKFSWNIVTKKVLKELENL